MPNAYKVLGQSNPSATTLTTLYTVPASTAAVVSTVCVANLAATSGTFRIAIRPGGASIANSHYVAYDAALLASDSVFLTLGITLAAGDVVSVYASSANIAFSAFGSEIT